MEITLFLKSAVLAGTPLLFATLGAIMMEKAGHTNLGVEGLMLLGAVGGFIGGLVSGSALIGILAALLAGVLGGLIYAVLTVSLQANHVVSGLALSIFGTGISGYVGRMVMGNVLPASIKQVFRTIEIPLLSKIPILGPMLFQHNIFIYAGYLCTIAMGIYFSHTRMGLNLRSVGENPGAADASGIDVNKYKYLHLLAGSAICALGGAYLSMVHVPVWQENITAGRGWIAVALVIFSMWSPYKAFFGSVLFGGLDIIGFRLQQTGIAINQYLIAMLPYAITILVLILTSIGKIGQQAPASLGQTYFREDR